MAGLLLVELLKRAVGRLPTRLSASDAGDALAAGAAAPTSAEAVVAAAESVSTGACPAEGARAGAGDAMPREWSERAKVVLKALTYACICGWTFLGSHLVSRRLLLGPI